MKRGFAIAAIILATLSLATGCRPRLPTRPAAAYAQGFGDDVPESIWNAVRDAPEGALVGIGVARMENIALARTIAETRARDDISRQLHELTESILADYATAAGTDPAAAIALQEGAAVTVRQSTLRGATIIDEARVDGEHWVVVALSRENAAVEIATAVESAWLAFD